MTNKKDKVYIGGGMFNDAQIMKRKEEEQQLKNNHIDLNIYNPITAPFNDKANNKPTAKEIFWGDVNQIIGSKYLTADIEMNTDDGLCYEMGVCSGINIILDMLKKGMTPQQILDTVPYKTILAHCSDIRQDSEGYSDVNVPFGINQFNKGGIDSHGRMFRHFEEIVKYLNNKKNNKEED